MFKVGKIGVTYDNPSRILPLIIRTGEHKLKLPNLVPPRGIQLSPQLFTCTFSPEKVVKGEILAEDAREALIHGTSYHWQRESLHQSASILWRTA